MAYMVPNGNRVPVGPPAAPAEGSSCVCTTKGDEGDK